MQTITTIGLDIAKSVFQVRGVNAGGQVVIWHTRANALAWAAGNDDDKIEIG
jgi:hypothetical protein